MVTEQAVEGVAEEGVDLRLAGGLAGGVKVAEKVNNFFGFEVDALDFVVRTAAFDGGPFNNGSAAGNGFAHVGLLENLFEAGAGAAIGNELVGSELGVAGAVDDIEEAEFDGVGDGDAEVEVPGRGRRGRAGA